MDHTITIFVEDSQGARHLVEAPTDMGLNLMEVLKASGYPIEATCGGMALCATCHIEVIEDPGLSEAQDAELDMLDLVPNLTGNSRLSCQIRPEQRYDGLVLRILGDS
jgi:2Fe-2S ferredoxin